MRNPLSKPKPFPLREAWKHATQWSAFLDWFVQRIVKMNAVFKPVIQAPG
jgi:hypothetical protein